MSIPFERDSERAKVRQCARLGQRQMAASSRIDAQIAIMINVKTGATCLSGACGGPAQRPEAPFRKGRRVIRGVRSVQPGEAGSIQSLLIHPTEPLNLPLSQPGSNRSSGLGPINGRPP
jgi:hypothetical protein